MMLFRRLYYLIRLRRMEADLHEEMAFHRELSGARAFGSSALAQNRSRDVWIPVWLQDASQDVRFAARLLARDRRFTITAVLALSLGIAATNTIFVFINTTLFRDLPFADPDRVVALQTIDRRGRMSGASYVDFLDWRAGARAFRELAATANSTANVSDQTRAPERVNSAYVTANAFRLIGRDPIVGRGFLPEDERLGAPAVVMLGYTLWTGRYASDPSIVGRSIRVNGSPAAVIGVMPDDFRFPMIARLWQPLAASPSLTGAPRGTTALSVIGRLADGVTLEQARADIAAVADRLAREYPATNAGVRATAAPMLDETRRSSLPILLTLMGAVTCVLLIACANVANLLLARAATRAREIAIRASLGASRARIVRQLLIESLLLALLAGGAALVLSLWSVRYFGIAFDAIEAAGTSTPFWVNLRMNGPVFVFLAAACLGSSVLFGLVPALHVSNVDVTGALKDGGATGQRRATRWTHALMIGELALTVVLLAGAGLVVRSFVVLYTTNVVIDTAGIVTGRLTLPARQYATPDARKALLRRLDERLAGNRAFAAAYAASDLPLTSFGPASRELAIDGRAVVPGETAPLISTITVGRRAFETLGLRAVRGRLLTAVDGEAGHEGAVVNQRFATTYFADGDPIGRRIRVVDVPSRPASPWLTIVGVVPTIPGAAVGMALRDAADPLVYLPIAVDAGAGRTLAVVARGPASAAAVAAGMTALREDLRALDPDVPLFAVQTLDAVVERARFSLRFAVTLFGLLALIACVLSAVGLFALTAQGVAQRTREIGVRMALGAQASQVVWLFLRRTLWQLTIGLAIGLPGALWVGTLLRTFLVRIGPRDPLTLAAIVALLAMVALAAAALPARRAARIDPIVALRHE